ncbi:MAG: methylenetetrahydrofolate reductase [NAD(P)H] [Candidatus Marinimicrobia bacterium]|nr:methylenetetrahydrofolate reductase [NAD(P)H] [Candidatus Neomarinimicrobiota bacterium]
MKISDLYRESDTAVISCEFFAPKSEQGFQNLYKVFEHLKQISPAFYSVTYGAGGGTARPTLELVCKIQDEFGILSMPHLTCVNHTKEYLLNYVHELKDNGINNILALRGDMPGGGKFMPHPEGLRFASDVVGLVGELNHFCIGVAAHPEGHPDAISIEDDIKNLKTKLDAGADFAITQFFFENEFYYKFVEMTQNSGIEKPIIPGIIPFINANHVMKFAKMNGTHIPDALKKQMIEAGDDREKASELGIKQAVKQCRELLDRGVSGIHFYTLNKSKPTYSVLQSLGMI